MLESQKLKENKYTKVKPFKFIKENTLTGPMKKVDFLFQGVKESGEWDVYLIKIKTNKKTHCSTPSLRQLILLKSQSLSFLRLKLPTKVKNCGP